MEDAARMVNSLGGITADMEWVYDPNTTYGFKSVMVLRTDTTNNCLALGAGDAVTKLGFTPGTYDCGNKDRTDNNPEQVALLIEGGNLSQENSRLGPLIHLGLDNKLERRTGLSLLSDFHDNVCAETTAVIWEIQALNTEITALTHIVEETSQAAYDPSQIALDKAIAFRAECYPALAYDNAICSNWDGRIDGTQWVIDHTFEQQIIEGVNSSNVGVPVVGPGDSTIVSKSDFTMAVDPSFDRRIANYFDIHLPYTPDSTVYYEPVIRFRDNLDEIPGTWTGWDYSVDVDGSYSVNNQVVFTMNTSVPQFNIVYTPGDKTNVRYSTDSSALAIRWEDGTTTSVEEFPYTSYTTIGDMRTAINLVPDITTNGTATVDASSPGFLAASGSITTTNIYPSLRPAFVDYYTISEKTLSDRTDYVPPRAVSVAGRFAYLDGTREEQIRQHVIDEELLRSLDGEEGNLYIWANNRYNRRQGCEARLVQTEKLIEMNGTALSVNQTLL
jgi:hypothetical protein